MNFPPQNLRLFTQSSARTVLEIGCGKEAALLKSRAEREPGSLFIGADPALKGATTTLPNLVFHPGKASDILASLTGCLDEVVIVAPAFDCEAKRRIRDELYKDPHAFKRPRENPEYRFIAETLKADGSVCIYTDAPEWAPVFHSYLRGAFLCVETVIHASPQQVRKTPSGQVCLSVKGVTENDYGGFDLFHWPFAPLSEGVNPTIEGQWGSVMGVFDDSDRLIPLLPRERVPDSRHFSGVDAVTRLLARREA